MNVARGGHRTMGHREQVVSAEPGTRFSSLLQPIRDLSKIWNIEIAEELEKYIEEVEQLVVTDPEGGFSQLNFAEAALLVQGSTAVYSRKVELLYSLVYQALDVIVPCRKDGANGKGRKVGPQNGLWAPIPETDELLTIDHLIKEGRNILLDPPAAEHQQASLPSTRRRVPLFLMPRDVSDKKRREFLISSCTVHRSGAYLLRDADSRLLDSLLAGRHSDHRWDDAYSPLPAPPGEVRDLDERLQALLCRPEDGHGGVGNADVGDRSGEDAVEAATGFDHAGEIAACLASPLADATPASPIGVGAGMEAGTGGNANGFSRQKRFGDTDPWELIDEHACTGKTLPLEVGRTGTRAMNAKRLQVTLDNMPLLCDWEPLSDADRWGIDAGGMPSIINGSPVESLFASIAWKLRPGRFEVQKAGYSSAWLDVEDLFVAATSKRRALRAAAAFSKAQKLSTDCSFPPPECHDAVGECLAGSDDERAANDREDPQANDGLPPQDEDCIPFDDLGETLATQDEHRREVAELETKIAEAQHKYEDTVRQHLQKMQKDTFETDEGKFPQLYANVKRWQEQLAPVLKEQQARPEFNIKRYSAQVLNRLSGLSEGAEGIVVPFEAIADGQPRWEVCRRFLTCLMLTNHGNTDIVVEKEEDRFNTFGVKLLSTAQLLAPDEDDTACLPALVSKNSRRLQHGSADTAASSKRLRRVAPIGMA